MNDYIDVNSSHYISILNYDNNHINHLEIYMNTIFCNIIILFKLDTELI